MKKASIVLAILLAVGTLAENSAAKQQPTTGAANTSAAQAMTEQKGYWPDKSASKVVSLARTGLAPVMIVIQTHAVAVKETGPKATVAKFGEVYAWSPQFIAVHQNEPTRIRFWNLQPDDMHDFMLVSPKSQVLMKLLLPPLSDKSYVFTFHQQGLYTFLCSIHTPEMMGQILVLPPVRHR
ncbi:MAG TPA: hypothetical protein VNJ12_08585 [Candidatus Dormibacteraeota bacterium]|nr:hypothetical protein [Candidatus Dormibacteraeota bacterium]